MNIIDGEVGGMSTITSLYTCPCVVCPTCKYERDDWPHPEDGLSSCPVCQREWWAHAGPHMDGRHIMSRADQDDWSAYDATVLLMGVDGP